MLNIDRLKKLRKENNYKQNEVAEILNIGRTTYAKYETGDIQPPIDQIVKISDLYGISTDWLLNRSDDPRLPGGKESPDPLSDDEGFVTMRRLYEQRSTKDRSKMAKIMQTMFEEFFPEDKE